MVNVRDERQTWKLSEIQSDPTRVTARVAGLGACLLFGGALASIQIVLCHGDSVILLLCCVACVIN